MTDNRTRLLSIVSLEMGAIQTTAEDPINARFSELGGDSLHRISLLVEIEEEFGVEISDDEDAALGSDATIRSVLELIERKLAAKVAA
jgi:acyl carrier protein